ncbi:MAG: LamG domain-containing protein [Myxococcota bacterium]
MSLEPIERTARMPWPQHLDRRGRGGLRVGLEVLGVMLLACTPEVFFVEEPATSGEGASSTSIEIETDSAVCRPSDPVEDWWDPSWRRRRRIEIDTAPFANDPAISAPLLNFPLLVRLPAEDLGKTWSEREGADLRVRAADQEIALDYDIDQVDAGGELSLWVKIPEIIPDLGPLVVWLYYDNPEAPAGERAQSVWADFISVHHLGADLLDSAGSHHGASPWEPELCDGECGPRIGAARRFVPELLHEVILEGEQGFDLGHDPFHESTRSFSVTLWMQSTSLNAYESGGLVAKGDDTWKMQTYRSSNGVALSLEQTALLDPCECEGDCAEACTDQSVGECMDMCLDMCPEDVICACSDQCVCEGIGDGYEYDGGLADCEYKLKISPESANGNVNDGQWHYVAMTVEGLSPMLPSMVQLRLYVDGAEAAASSVLELQVPEDDAPVRFGHNLNTHRRWGGSLDEIRIMSGARGAAEIAADYVTVDQDPPTVGAGQSICR